MEKGSQYELAYAREKLKNVHSPSSGSSEFVVMSSLTHMESNASSMRNGSSLIGIGGVGPNMDDPKSVVSTTPPPVVMALGIALFSRHM